jgi:hypothetical protein
MNNSTETGLFYTTGVVRLCGYFSIDTFPHSAEKKLLGEVKSFYGRIFFCSLVLIAEIIKRISSIEVNVTFAGKFEDCLYGRQMQKVFCKTISAMITARGRSQIS